MRSSRSKRRDLAGEDWPDAEDGYAAVAGRSFRDLNSVSFSAVNSASAVSIRRSSSSSCKRTSSCRASSSASKQTGAEEVVIQSRFFSHWKSRTAVSPPGRLSHRRSDGRDIILGAKSNEAIDKNESEPNNPGIFLVKKFIKMRASRRHAGFAPARNGIASMPRRFASASFRKKLRASVALCGRD
jgi:hypothetical protein